MELGLGLAALGRPAYLVVGHGEDFAEQWSVEAMRTRTHELLNAALAAGIRCVDTARSYGRAEEFLSTWPHLAQMTVSSKWGYRYVGDWKRDAAVHEVKDHSLAALERQWAETRAFFRPSLYQIHSATLDSGVLDDAAVLRRLRALKDEGVRVGLSVTGPKQADVIRKALTLRLFDAVQATWNLWERSAGDALREARAHGLQVLVKEGLANGRLTHRAGFHPGDGVALAAVLRQDFTGVALSGAVTVAQLRSNLSAFAASPAEVDAALSEVTPVPPEQYWAERAKLPWT